MSSYLPRIADQQVAATLRRAGAILIEGPKGCGKTETTKQFAKSMAALDPGSKDYETAKLDPRLLLSGEAPRLIDEWQNVPEIWDAVRREVDESKAKGGFILTGSTAPSENAARHSGAGRFARIKMSTMTFAETGHSSKAVSINALIDGEEQIAAAPNFSIVEIVQRMCHGGWPGHQELNDEDAMASVIDYLEDVAAVDIRKADGVQRDKLKVSRLIRALARAIGTEVSVATLAKDTGLSRDVISDYLISLERIYVQIEQPAWNAHLRSKATFRQAPKRHLADPALAVAALRANSQSVLNDLEFAGQLFESQVFHDISAYLERGSIVTHARDSAGREVDLVVQKPNGHWALIEVKLGSRQEVVDSAASALINFKSHIDLSKQEFEPELIVITANGVSHTRSDGVKVAALTALIA